MGGSEQMKERPFFLKDHEILSTLEGRMSRIRRSIKGNAELIKVYPNTNYGWDGNIGKPLVCPYGQSDDRLWVRESFKHISSGTIKDGYGEIRYGHAYKADGATEWNAGSTIVHDITGRTVGPMQFLPAPWEPSIHMPRRASRILLEITAVRVERLQDISEEDAKAEGVNFGNITDQVTGEIDCDAAEAYEQLWESINGKGSWSANPWVWVISFQRIEPK